MAISQDGFIADEKGGVDWLAPTHTSGEDYGMPEFLDSIDTIVMGWNSYNQQFEFGPWAWSHKITYVFTDHPEQNPPANVHFFSGSIEQFIQYIEKNSSQTSIWLFGGAQLTQSFHDADVIDEYIVTVVPVALKSGIAFPDSLLQDKKFILKNTTTYKDGCVQKHFVRRA